MYHYRVITDKLNKLHTIDKWLHTIDKWDKYLITLKVYRAAENLVKKIAGVKMTSAIYFNINLFALNE